MTQMEGLDNLIAAARTGTPDAVDHLFRATYTELRALAHRRLRRSSKVTILDTTVLVHECYLRLAKLGAFRPEDRAFFLGYAARAMRSIVIDMLRGRAAARHGGGATRVTLATDCGVSATSGDEDVMRINDAVEELGKLDPRLAQVVEMKYFAGMTFAEIGSTLNVTERTARRDWQKARMLLHSTLSG
jgi:RNA polymerase sigma factor (TIGR02999 family)